MRVIDLCVDYLGYSHWRALVYHPMNILFTNHVYVPHRYMMYYGFASLSLFNLIYILMAPVTAISAIKEKSVKKKADILRRHSSIFHPAGVAHNLVHLTMGQRLQVRSKIVSTLLAKKKKAQKNIEKRKQMEKKTE